MAVSTNREASDKERAALAAAAAACGGMTALAAALGVSRPTVYGWMRFGVPGDWVVKVAGASNGAVSPAQLRPDLARAFKR